MVIILTALATDSHYQQRKRPLLQLILILTLHALAIATHSQQHERDLLQLQLILKNTGKVYCNCNLFSTNNQ